MSEVQLNKPLYKSGSDGQAPNRPVMPRPARASMMPRGGAILLDILLLHFAYLLLIKLAPGVTVALGKAGPWIGLLVAWIYFSVCSSQVTWGKSLGKLVMRLQVSDITGPDLPLPRAALRAALLLAGCVFPIAIKQYTSRIDDPSGLNPVPSLLSLFGWLGINIGWLLGNLLHGVYDPLGRTFYDRVTGSVVTASDSEPALLQEFFEQARVIRSELPRKRSTTALLVTMVVLMSIPVAQYKIAKKSLAELTSEQRATYAKLHQAFYVPGYGAPALTGKIEAGTAAAGTTPTQVLAATLTYNHHGPLDVATLKQSPLPASKLRDILMVSREEPSFQDWLANMFNQMNKERVGTGQGATTIPREMRMEVSFAEAADLFFASDSIPRYAISQTVGLELGDPTSSRPLTIHFPDEINDQPTTAPK